MSCLKPDQEKTWEASDLAFIVPTKDRPEELRQLLHSVSCQKVSPGRILVVDGATSGAGIVREFLDLLPVEYYRRLPPSLIGQRNFGLDRLDNSTPLVGFIDDDIRFEDTALEEMIEFWNSAPDDTAAVSFNIINVPRDRGNRLQRLLYLCADEPGRVLKSGVTTTYHNYDRVLRTEWVCGGATIWKQEILNRYPRNKDIRSRWAVCEDLIFSYPIGRRHPLYLCPRAKVTHGMNGNAVGQKICFRYMGHNEVLWRLYFVRVNSELATGAWFLYAFGRTVQNVWIGYREKNRGYIMKAVGNIEGCAKGVLSLLGRKSLEDLLDENGN